MAFRDLRRSKKERFMHGDNLKDYEAMHKAINANIAEERKKISDFMRSKPYGTRKEGT